MADHPLFWPIRIRAERKARKWDTHAMARQLREAAGEDRHDLPEHGDLVRSIRRWESGAIALMSERYRLLYCAAFQLDEATLFAATAEPTAPCLSLEADNDLGKMRSLRQADRQVGGGHLYASVLGYLQADIAPRLFGGSDGPQAFVAAAAFTEMAGWMAHDAGKDNIADRHFCRALDFAKTSGDLQLEAHIMGSMSHLARHRGQAEEAIRLAQLGTARLGSRTTAPRMQARLLSMAARAHAVMGESNACARLLIRAEDALTHEQATSHSPWAGPFDEGTLALDTARAMLCLGQLGEAQRQGSRALKLRARDRTRSRALSQLLLAQVMLAQDHVDEACARAKEAVEDTRSLSSFVIAQQLADLRGQLQVHKKHASVPETLRSLDNALRERYWLFQWGDSHRGPGRTAVRA